MSVWLFFFFFFPLHVYIYIYIYVFIHMQRESERHVFQVPLTGLFHTAESGYEPKSLPESIGKISDHEL